ncbi:hypothetical protein EK0264_14900 [Epidermidibacterium keratini]|uniref:Uncharacterized protein n=1 Tax=Epidermidibacterium keratini TaxID=1891644 RepID=A0A7L4YQV5_9ACTN|nr:hypothetical protein [Epidermidibacterium keratini]QHC01448.1 hypothetical protein EK0264_14900 [Epidermidibacterium keratini]
MSPSEQPKKRPKGGVVRRSADASASAPAPAAKKASAGKKSVAKGTAAKAPAGKKTAAKKPAAKQAPTKKVTAKKVSVKQGARPRPATVVPEPTVRTYFAESGGLRPLVGLTGALAVAGTALLVVADYVPYLRLDGQEVSAPISVWSILGHVLLLALALIAGGALIVGRGGRTAITALVPLIALAPGKLLIAWYDGDFLLTHPGLEYYFGTAYTTTAIEGLAGRAIMMAGCAVLALAGLTAIAAWRTMTERDLIPLEGARYFPSGAAVVCAVLAIIALAVPAAVPAVQKYTDPSGFVLTRDIQAPASAVSIGGVALAGGIVLMVGWLVAGAFVGSRSTRTALVGGLVGIAVVAGSSALFNLRDVLAGPDVVGGPRLYLYAAAGVLAAVAAVYAAKSRMPERDELVSDAVAEPV